MSAKKYFWTPERDELLRSRYDSHVKGRAGEIAAELGWPTWVIKKRAGALGITRPSQRKAWTPDELHLLRKWTGKKTSIVIARRLGRSEASVVLKQKRLKLSRRVTDGYTLVQVAEALGVDHKKVAEWIARGWLRARKRNAGHLSRLEKPRKAAWFITDDAVRAFIRAHPLEFHLGSVSQEWFLRLVLGYLTCAACGRHIEGEAVIVEGDEYCREHGRVLKQFGRSAVA